jgi:hypothetical protein
MNENMKFRIHFLTYGNDRFRNSKKRILKEAERLGVFHSRVARCPDDLDENFREQFKRILNCTRLGGYGIWKPHIVLRELERMKDGDGLVYLDAGCTINLQGEKRFWQYIQMVKDSEEGMLSFQLPHCPERDWTTRQTFDYFKMDLNHEHATSSQYLSGILVMKKCPAVIEAVSLWLKAVYEQPLLFTDDLSGMQSYPGFREHRHDQSFFSIIRKKFGTITLPDETWFVPFGNDQSMACPFWATRLRV